MFPTKSWNSALSANSTVRRERLILATVSTITCLRASLARTLLLPILMLLSGLHNDPRVYCVVGFKANRAEVYVRDSITQFVIDVRPGQDVIVEADRGQDIGQVLFTTTSLYKADRFSRTMNLKHHRELVRSSFRFSHKWREIESPHVANPPNGPEAGRRLKVIKRMANQTDLMSIFDKENMEARCKRICQDLVMRHRLDMEVLEAEWQA